MRKLALLLLVVLLIPAQWLRDGQPARGGPAPVGPASVGPASTGPAVITRHDLMPGLGSPLRFGPFTLVGAWQITGNRDEVGNYSALGLRCDGRIVAVSDRDGMMTFTRPDRPGPWAVALAHPVPLGGAGFQMHSDSEALAILPPRQHGGCGDMLIFYEGTEDILRFSPGLKRQAVITIPALGEWPINQGPEASAVLADGRTVMLEEGYAPWWDRTRHTGFVFPALPVSGESPGRFTLVLAPGYRPTELAQLPDGQLLLLERKFTLGGFRSAIAVLDPRSIRPGATVAPRELARIEDPRIRDNYEGMTVTRESDGALALWLISDSNQMVWLQRTLLLKLRFARL